jgi:hypothetical protein
MMPRFQDLKKRRRDRQDEVFEGETFPLIQEPTASRPSSPVYDLEASGSASGDADSAMATQYPEGKTYADVAVTPKENTNIFRRKENTTFDNDSLQDFYKPIDTYEGRHRYDPEFEWTPKEEKKLVRKVALALLQ